MVQHEERRRFIRHPVCYPLEFEYSHDKVKERTSTVNISKGGLLFVSKHKMLKGKLIILKLPLKDKIFKIKARVEHVTQDEDNSRLFDIGVSFYRFADAFKVKLIEQIYLIDEYRSLRSMQLGREISIRDASEEWIRRYSKKFAKLYW